MLKQEKDRNVRTVQPTADFVSAKRKLQEQVRHYCFKQRNITLRRIQRNKIGQSNTQILENRAIAPTNGTMAQRGPKAKPTISHTWPSVSPLLSRLAGPSGNVQQLLGPWGGAYNFTVTSTISLLTQQLNDFPGSRRNSLWGERTLKRNFESASVRKAVPTVSTVDFLRL